MSIEDAKRKKRREPMSESDAFTVLVYMEDELDRMDGTPLRESMRKALDRAMQALIDSEDRGQVPHCWQCEYAKDVNWLGEHRLYCAYREQRGKEIDMVLDRVSEDDYCSKGRM